MAFEAGKPLESDITPDVTVTGDADKLRQLIGVLLDNAIKYGQAGGTISLTLRRTDRQARLLVSNPGDPIPPDQLGRCSSDSTGRTPPGGSSLASAWGCPSPPPLRRSTREL